MLLLAPAEALGGGGGFGGAGGGGGGNPFGGGRRVTAQVSVSTLITQIKSNALSPDIESSVAIMSRGGYVQTDNLNRTVTIYGVDYNTYSQIYSTTFTAATGTIPTNPSDNQIVVGTRVNQPGQNGTIYFNVGDKINVSWTNATVLPPVNETYTADVSGVLAPIGGFGIGGPSDTGVYIPINQAESFFGTDQCDMIIVKLTNSDNATITNVTKLITDHFSNQVSVVSSTQS